MSDTEARSHFSLEKIKKKYRFHSVINELSLSLDQGDIALLLGANGSGKSTLLKICAGLIRPDQGTVYYQQTTKPIPFTQIGYATHELMLYKRLSVEENLSLFHRLSAANGEFGAEIQKWNLDSLRGRAVAELSKGQQYRVSLCRAFHTDPRFLFLDEPSTALDEDALSLLESNIKAQAASGSSILIATHDLDRLLPFANKVLVLHQGRIAQKSVGDHSESIAYYRQVNR